MSEKHVLYSLKRLNGLVHPILLDASFSLLQDSKYLADGGLVSLLARESPDSVVLAAWHDRPSDFLDDPPGNSA
ncbi:MAG TPA: hypothetical protein VN578_15900 [Candidatus Binatia bacterium]|nr:hypothetical protein [Candidatus Binatia bacterium]